MKAIIDESAVAQLRAAYEAGRLRSGSWGGAETVCMMSAVVEGAKSTDDCVTAGWPKWLAELNVSLFDASVGAKDEDGSRFDFALAVFNACTVPRDYDKARDMFLIRRLDTGDYSALKSLRLNPVDADWWRDCEQATITVAGLLHRRVTGEDVSAEMASATDAAYAAYAATITAAARAAYATDAADDADAAARAAYAAYAARAAYAADDAARAAARAAYAAARADLIAALLAA